MNEQIIYILYNEIFPNISIGKVELEDIKFNINFNIIIKENGIHYPNEINNEVPTLIINNLYYFNRIIIDLINEIINNKSNWCCPYLLENTSLIMKIKYYLITIWSNMNPSDFNNPIAYLNRYLSFLQDNTFDNFIYDYGQIEELNNYHLCIENKENKACSETPNALKVTLVDEEGNQKWYLPEVFYGINYQGNKKEAYIYAVQYNKNSLDKNEKSNNKKLKRTFYKVDLDVLQDEIKLKNTTQIDNDCTENIVDVSPSSLISLTAALSLFSRKDITKIIVPNEMPIRWQSKAIAHEKELIKLANSGAEECLIDEKAAFFEEEQTRIGRNTNDKLIRNFRRLDYHFDGMEITAYPLDADLSMHIDLSNEFQPYNNNHLLGLISNQITKKVKIK